MVMALGGSPLACGVQRRAPPSLEAMCACSLSDTHSFGDTLMTVSGVNLVTEAGSSPEVVDSLKVACGDAGAAVATTGFAVLALKLRGR